ncbi:MAG: tetratricopeptide repeat protein [Bacteroidetes bacterium]|nr:tetratricopeptide repeat protein [Bacteroidota bacterium]
MIKAIQETSSEKNFFAKKEFLLLFLILLFAFIAFFPSLKNGFNNWDDEPYITSNKYLELTKENVLHSFLKGEHHPMYVPLTALSHSIVHYFAGMRPFLYHLVNVLIHLVNISLVFFFIQLLFKKTETALIVSLLFAIHTMQVESVAYVAGRRDILYASFFLLTLIFYLKYLMSNRKKFLIIGLIAFIFSLLSKGQAVMLPFVLIAIDWFYSRNIFSKKVIIEKIPFFVLSLLFGLVVVHVFNTSSWAPDITLEATSWTNQIFVATYGFTKYCMLLVAPINLSIIHPYPDLVNGFPFYYWLCLIFVIGFFILLVRKIKTTDSILKMVVFGLMFFIINIALVLQIIPNSYSIINEHYVYIASIGFFILLAALFEKCSKEKTSKNIFTAIFSVYLLILSVNTFNRCKVFRDSITVWSDVLKKYDDSYVAFYNRGVAYKDLNEYKKAIIDFNKSIEMRPEYDRAYTNRGAIRVILGDYNGAIEDFNQTIKHNPHDTTALFNRGNAKAYIRDFKGAIEDYNKTIEYGKIDFEAINWRGKAKFYSGDFQNAIKDFNSCIVMGDTSADVRFNRGSVLANVSELKLAIMDFNKAIELNSNYDNAYLNRGLVKINLDDKDGGCTDLRKAITLGNTAAKEQLGKLCGK